MEEKDIYCTKKTDVVKPHENMPIVTLNLKWVFECDPHKVAS